MRWALVRRADNIVDNVIEYDGVSEYAVPDGHILVEINDWIEIGMNAAAQPV